MNKVLLLAPMSSVHERFNIANLEALGQLGCEIHLAANFSWDEHARAYREQLHQMGCTTYDIAFVRGSLVRNLACIPKLRRLLSIEKFDLVHCHTETGGLLTRLSMSAAPKTKYVYTPHGFSFYESSSRKSQCLYRPLERWICAKMSAVLAMNREEWEVLQTWNANTACFVHGVGVSLNDMHNPHADRIVKKAELGMDPNVPLILSAGELNANKNHKVMLYALSKMAGPKPAYLICGEGDKRQVLTTLAQQLGISDRVSLPGYRYDLPELLTIADVFVFPSYHEGLSVALMQAMSSGLPVVCSAIRGNVDLIVPGKGGYLHSPDDVEGFGASVEKLLADAPLREAMGAFNRERVRDYSLKTVRAEVQKIYQDML